MPKPAAQVGPTEDIPPTRTAVERMAAFAHAAQPQRLTPRTRSLSTSGSEDRPVDSFTPTGLGGDGSVSFPSYPA